MKIPVLTLKFLRRRSVIAVLSVLVSGACVLGYTFLEPYWLKIRRYAIADSQIPASFDGATIVFLSDIHHGPFFSLNRVRRVVRRVNALQPDLVILGGDYVHREPTYIVPCFEALRELTAPLGVFGVLGNHDHWEDAELTGQQMRQAGITLLDNHAVWIERGQERIKLGGVGDFWEDQQDLTPTLADVREEDFVLLVSHNPDYVEELRTTQIDLMLSGHTHGGQVSLFGFWAPLVPSRYGQKYRTGLVETPYTRILITNGVGTITPPVRFCVRPEVVVIQLSKI